MTVDEQLGWIEEWLQGDDAVRTADRLVRRRQLGRQGQELLNEAWIRCTEGFARRGEPYPDMVHRSDAIRFAARVIDNLSRDWARGMQVTSVVDGVELVESDGARTARTEERMLVEQLLRAVGRRAQAGVPCAGCRPEIVAAAALEVLHLVLAGRDGGTEGRTWFDRVLYEALDRSDAGGAQRTTAARAQFKARCGRCVRSLLETAGRDLGEVVT